MGRGMKTLKVVCARVVEGFPVSFWNLSAC